MSNSTRRRLVSPSATRQAPMTASASGTPSPQSTMSPGIRALVRCRTAQKIASAWLLASVSLLCRRCQARSNSGCGSESVANSLTGLGGSWVGETEGATEAGGATVVARVVTGRGETAGDAAKTAGSGDEAAGGLVTSPEAFGEHGFEPIFRPQRQFLQRAG